MSGQNLIDRPGGRNLPEIIQDFEQNDVTNIDIL